MRYEWYRYAHDAHPSLCLRLQAARHRRMTVDFSDLVAGLRLHFVSDPAWLPSLPLLNNL
jgi:hypothetical protein